MLGGGSRVIAEKQGEHFRDGVDMLPHTLWWVPEKWGAPSLFMGLEKLVSL